MIHKCDSPSTSSVSFRVPDFVDADGIEYTDIEVVVEMDGDIRETANVAEAMQRTMTAEDGEGRRSPLND
jgi:hypothetical protein